MDGSHPADTSLQVQLLEQLATTLRALHSLGIVHLNIRPELIYLGGEGGRVEIILGGLDQAVFYKQAGRAVTAIDPFYAPPEAVNPEGAQPGIGLCAWDWWTVGRMIQEMILGRHVMTVLFGGDVTREPAPALAERARALLLELEPPGLRAGAIEAMPELSPSTKVLLRGLLTSARDARWGGDAISQWLTHDEVSNHYDLARDARFFTWNGRGCTLVEAARYFRMEEPWADGEKNIFESDNPETLANFLSTMPVHRGDWHKVQEIIAQVAALDLGQAPEHARRAITASLVWLTLGPQPGVLIIKGRRMDTPGVTELLGIGQDSGNGDIVKALISASCIALIKQVDSTAAEALARLALVGGMALRQAGQYSWIDQNDPVALSSILKLSLENEHTLRKRAERVRAAYAACGDSALDGMLEDKNPAAWVQVLLVVTAENPRRYGYVTRVEQERQQVTDVRSKSEQLQVALFWLHLKQLLLAGRPWSGDWQMFSVFWLILVVFGVAVARDVTSTALLAFALLGLRFFLGWHVQKLVRQCDPTASSWTVRDGPERCLAEAQRAWPETISLPALAKQVDETKAAMLTLQPDGAPVSTPDYAVRLRALLPVYIVTILIGVVGAIQLLKNLGQNFGYQVMSIAATEPAQENPSKNSNRYVVDSAEDIAAQLQNLPELDPEMMEKVKRGEYEIVKESFGYTLNGPIQKWAFTPPAVVPPLPVESKAPATSAQRAFALVSGELLLRPYGRKGVTALFVVPVPTKTGFGLMVYNAKERKLIDNVALTLHEGLPDKTWYRVDRYNVIYLGSPSQIGKSKDGLVTLR